MSRLLASLAVAVAAFPGCASASGLHGVVTRGPTQPVCRIGEACTAPAAGTTLVFTRGSAVRRTVTGAKGEYRISLPPGVYRVRVAAAFQRLTPVTVVVRSGASRLLDFDVDTGIR